MTNLGTYIRDRRKVLSLNQGEFADQAGIQRPHLSQIESGRITWPQPELRRRIAAALGVTHVDLMVASGELSPEEATGTTDEAVPAAITNALRANHIASLAREARWTEPRMSIAQALFAAWRTEDTRVEGDDDAQVIDHSS